MNIFDNILLNLILILFPLMVCILCETYNRIYDKDKDNLYFDFACISSFYLILNFNNYNYFTNIIINIPLLLSYLKNKHNSIMILSFLIVLYLNNYYNIYFIIVEYIIYYFLYKIVNNKKIFLNIFIILKTIYYFLYYLSNINIINLLISIIIFIVMTYIIILILKKSDELLQFQKNLQELEKEKQLRLSLFKITHEIKNPIAVCKGYLEMFDIKDEKKSKKYLNIMKNEISRVLILLEDFLSINKIKIEKDIIDLNLLLEEVTNNFIPILKEKNIERLFKISKDELYINADYNRLNQVLINVIKNSIESMEDKGILSIYTKLNKTNVKIYIEDTGIGMDKEEITKIKEPFFTTKKNGTGLGVYLSKEIIKSHGGNIKYESKKNIGTKTIITLPYKEIKF